MLMLVVFFFVFSFLISRYRSFANWAFRIFLALIIFTGAQIVFATVIGTPFDVMLALLVLVAIVLIRKVLIYDIGIILGISGISALLGLSLTPLVAATILVLLSVYDIIAVYRTRHMVHLARSMVQSGAIFGFLIPMSWHGFWEKKEHKHAPEKFMILGSGDIGLPIVFCASLVSTSLESALLVGLFSIFGVFLTHLIFVNQKKRQPMAALPPIATTVILGYLVSLAIF
jgi:presenilin-like A22 family membrane protease